MRLLAEAVKIDGGSMNIAHKGAANESRDGEAKRQNRLKISTEGAANSIACGATSDICMYGWTIILHDVRVRTDGRCELRRRCAEPRTSATGLPRRGNGAGQMKPLRGDGRNH